MNQNISDNCRLPYA